MPDVVPVLDEAQALPWVLGRMPDGHRPIVVDEGASDGSGAIAAGLRALVVDEPRRGFGAARERIGPPPTRSGGERRAASVRGGPPTHRTGDDLLTTGADV